MKTNKIKKCEICKDRPGVNYDGRYICLVCWTKKAGR